MRTLFTDVARRLGAPAVLALAMLLPVAAEARLQMLDRIAAVVNDSVIMESELDQRVDDLARQFVAERQQLPPRDVLRPQVLERLIMEQLQLDMAERGGIRVDDGSLNQALAGIARQNDMSLDEFATAVQEDGFEWAAFREQIRAEMIISQLHQRQVARRVRITDREVDRFLESEMGRQLFESEFRLGHILIGLPDDATPDQVAAAQQEAEQLVQRIRDGADFREMAVSFSDAPQALEGGDLGWRPAAQLPTLFAEEALRMQPGQVSEPLRAGNGFHILQLIDRRGDAIQIVEQYRVRHILIRTSALRTPSQAERLIIELHNRIEGGESFEALAREYSEDPGSARAGGDLGWVSPGEMVPEFEQTFRETPVGVLSPVFQSEFGWHFLRVEDTRSADMSDEFRVLRARQALQQRRYEEELQQWLRETRAEAFVDIRI
ncbi:peptidylprolyl isomerase [Alcanivorax quisquiliarum]|uniref:Chaperone SurA n=1 Tax=Alcanivorax quisquiliarum TaxID=2933565 RepID=A0ABT0E6D3_9GAMM|nr:peptidylprolyl isomerase [Alcanivorax quisquiliarum]MCK0537388.1 peptidylprolyl isomerase [Alcanivorax quisquiliarum]